MRMQPIMMDRRSADETSRSSSIVGDMMQPHHFKPASFRGRGRQPSAQSSLLTSGGVLGVQQQDAEAAEGYASLGVLGAVARDDRPSRRGSDAQLPPIGDVAASLTSLGDDENRAWLLSTDSRAGRTSDVPVASMTSMPSQRSSRRPSVSGKSSGFEVAHQMPGGAGGGGCSPEPHGLLAAAEPAPYGMGSFGKHTPSSHLAGQSPNGRRTHHSKGLMPSGAGARRGGLVVLGQRAVGAAATGGPLRCWSGSLSDIAAVLATLAPVVSSQTGVLALLPEHPLLAGCDESSRQTISSLLKPRAFEAGQCLVAPSSRGGGDFHFLLEGRVLVHRSDRGSDASDGSRGGGGGGGDGRDKTGALRTLSFGDVVGEWLLLSTAANGNNGRAAAEVPLSAKCAEWCTTLACGADELRPLLAAEGLEWLKHQQAALGLGDQGPASLSDLRVVGVLGRGSFGLVSLVSHSSDGSDANGDFSPRGNGGGGGGAPQRFYALKAMKRARFKTEVQREHVLSERSILGSLRHPLLVRLHTTFRTEQALYMLLDAVMGGEFFTYLADVAIVRRRLFTLLPHTRMPPPKDVLTTAHNALAHPVTQDGRVSESSCRFYTGCIALMLEHLHGLNVVYRDLKPENLMITKHGYLKLVDFGCVSTP